MLKKPTYKELEQRVKELEGKEVEIRASEVKFRELFDYMSSGVAIYEAKDNGNDFIFKDLNQAGERIENIKKENLLGKSVLEMFPGVKEFGLFDVLRRVWKTGKPEHHPVSLYKDNRITGWKENFVYKLQSGEIVAVYDDITESKQVEKALRESEERYKSLFKNNHSVMLLIDPESANIVDANPAAISFYGWSHEELTRKKITDINTLTERQVFQEMKRAKTEQHRIFYFKHRLASGKIRYVEIYSGLIKVYDRELLYSVIHDITKRKQAEEALLESKELYRTLIDTIPHGVQKIDTSGIITFANPSHNKIFGYTKDEMIGKSILDLQVSDSARNDLSTYLKILLKDQPEPAPLITPNIRKDGTIIYVQVDWNYNRDVKGNIKGFISVVTDITGHKRAEELLRESEERFRNLTETTSDWLWEVDKNGCYTYVSPKIYDILGYREEEMKGKAPFDLMPPAEADRVFKIFKTIRASQQPFDCLENINLHKNGHPLILETSGVPIFNDDGEFTGYRGVDRDITKRKRIEEELRKAHDELENRVAERTRELKIEKSNLEEANIAMQVLLDKRQKDKKETEDNVLTNVKELIVPYIEKIRRTKLDDQQKAVLSIIESYLNEIISPFTRKMSLKYLNLTPTEIQVANLIRHGSNSKEIAELMGLSPRTIYNHRKNIRKKFGLENKKTNLRSHLLSTY
jgi:PAS domain S-box-containing protein